MKRRGIYKLMFSEKNEMGIDGKGHAKIGKEELRSCLVVLLPSFVVSKFSRVSYD